MYLCPSWLRLCPLLGLHLLLLTLMLLPDTSLCVTVPKKDPGTPSFNATRQAKEGQDIPGTNIPPQPGGGSQGENGVGSALTTQTPNPSSSPLLSSDHETNLNQSQRNNTVQTLNLDGKSYNQLFVQHPLNDSITPLSRNSAEKNMSTDTLQQPSVPPPVNQPFKDQGTTPLSPNQSPQEPSKPISSLTQVNLSTAAPKSPYSTTLSVRKEPDNNVFTNTENNTVINTVQPGQGTTAKAEPVAAPTNTPTTRKATTPLPTTAKNTTSATVTIPTTAKSTTSTAVTVSTTAKSTTPAAITTSSTLATTTTVNTTVTATTTKKPSSTSVATQASTSPITEKPPVQSPPGSAVGNATTTTIANAASSTITTNTITDQKNHVVNTGSGVAIVEVTASDLTSHLVDTASLLAVLLFGLLFFLVTVAVFVTQAYDSYRRKDYTQVDYLINGMYTDSGV